MKTWYFNSLNTFIVTFSLIFSVVNGLVAQKNTYVRLSGNLECDGTNDTVSINYFIEKGTHKTQKMLSGGKYEIRLDFGKQYQVHFTRNNYAPQFIKVNTNVPEKFSNNVCELESDISLYLIAEEADKKPLLVASYKFFVSEGKGYFDLEDEEENLSAKKTDSKENESSDDIEEAIENLKKSNIVDEYTPEELDFIASREERIEKKMEELDNLKQQKTVDSSLLLEKTLDLQNTILENAKSQLKVEKMNAKTRKDSLRILEKERLIFAAEQRINLSSKNLQIKNYALQNQKTLIISAILSLILLIILFSIVYVNYKLKNKLNKQLEEKNTELERKQKEIEDAYEELKEKTAEIQAQKEEIESKNSQITSSLLYAQKIQESMLPSKESMKAIFSDYFIIFLPKDIVSGDFYWVEKVDNKVFIAVVDCTGHGVPGAFMSIIGTRILNEILFQRKVEDPRHMLELLNKGVKTALNQDEGENRDGMDVCLARLESINEKEYSLIYAGAKRPLFYFNNESGKIETMKGNRRPVGGLYYQHLPFTETESIVKRGDILYFTTDGFIDQNSPSGKKLGTKLLTTILESLAINKLDDQQDEIYKAYLNHKQQEEQRDDLTILGVKI